MLILWQANLATPLSGRTGAREGRVAASSKPSLLQTGALRSLKWQSWLQDVIFDSSPGKQGSGWEGAPEPLQHVCFKCNKGKLLQEV